MRNLKPLMDLGRQTRRKVFGDGDEQAWERLNDDFDSDFNEIMLGFRWGMITSRPGLDIKTRQLCAFATFLTAGEYEEVFIDRQIPEINDMLKKSNAGAMMSGKAIDIPASVR